MEFAIKAPFQPAGDQPQAINKLAAGVEQGMRSQVLLGATGTGKTYTIAQVINKVRRPTLVLAHNKTLAAQLASELKAFFPDNAVEYFVSYYDYYQPEAYIPQTDTYIEKDSSINDEIDKLRHSATSALFERRDVIVVASVSCIYGLGGPQDYYDSVVSLRVGQVIDRNAILRKLVENQYTRNDIDFHRGTFRVRGDVIEVIPASFGEKAVRIEMFDDEVEQLLEVDVLTGEVLAKRTHVAIFPASHYVTSKENMERAMADIRVELKERLAELKANGKLLEAQRLEQRTNYDLEMMEEMGYCTGIENYSRHMDNRKAGQAPFTLVNYFPKDFLLVVDESHVTIPQVRAMAHGDRARKEMLVNYGFRLPSAIDNLMTVVSESSSAVATEAMTWAAEEQAKLEACSLEKEDIEADQLKIREYLLKIQLPEGYEQGNAADVTAFIQTPGFSKTVNGGETNSIDGWQGTAGYNFGNDDTQKGALALEFYEKDFDMYQDVEGIGTVVLPDGNYKVTVSAFERVAESTPAFFYAQSGEATAEVELMKLADGVDEEAGEVAPNDMVSAVAAFENGKYLNELSLVVSGGKLRVGIKHESHSGSDWIIMDNFKLYFYANDNTAVETLVNLGKVVDVQYFTLDGRRVSAAQKGITIRKAIMDNGAVIVKKIRK